MKKWLIALGITLAILSVLAGLVCVFAFFPALALVVLAGIFFGVVLHCVKDSLD